ncbi:MAG TPA: NADH-quinone oxidoreductase subunit N [Vicinamibacterales bacterium]|nr:NADH-quinone oxidoreductase subunit N [Vicinamibacterales bacterium]
MPPGFAPGDFWLLLPEILLAATALVVLIADALLTRQRQGATAWMAMAGLAATALALVPIAGRHTTAAGGLMAVDAFAAFFKFLFLLAAALTILMSTRYLRIERGRPGTYYFFIVCATLGMLFMASGLDLVTLFIGLETMAISFYILAGFLKPNRRSNEAAVKYFLLGTFSLGLLLYGISLLYGLTGTTMLRDIGTALAGSEQNRWVGLAVILVVAGMGFKIAAVPFHMWAPDVYEGAPTPITAFLSVGSLAASFAMLLRIFFEALPSANADWGLLFYALAVLTMTVGNIAALTQSNIKRLLAYSSIAHAGYVLIGVVAATTVPQVGVKAAMIYLAVYAFMQIGAFGVVTMLRRQDVIGEELKDLGGLFSRTPLAALAMLLFLLSLGGIPPTAGFMGKFWLFSAAIDGGFYWLALIGVLNSAVSLYYYLRVVVFMWMKPEAGGSRIVVNPAMSVLLAVTIVATLAIGVYPRALFDLADLSARALGATGIAALP